MTNASNEVRALVVGAGPVGLTMAYELTRRGVNCRIIDKALLPTDKSKALVCHARTCEILENMGLIDSFLKVGHPCYGTNFYNKGKRLVHLSFDEMDSPFPYALMIPQSETERLLAEGLQKLGKSVERAVELVEFNDEGSKVVSTLRHPDGREEILETAWLLGCDGAHSTARHTLKFAFEGVQYPEAFATADLHVKSSLAEDEVHIVVSEDGMLAFFPLGEGRFRIIADTSEGKQTGDPLTMEEIQGLVNKRSEMDIKLSEPIWLTHFAIHRRSVNHYSQGRVFLSGDAAHIHSPALGQGMNTGMQDVYNLAWKLALVDKGAAKPELLNSYTAERHPVGQALLKTTDAVTKMATIRNPIAQAVRARLIPMLASHEVIQHRMLKMGGMLAINYRHSPIVSEYRSGVVHQAPAAWLDFGHGPAPGDRSNDAQVIDCATGQESRLYQILAGTKHNLLLFAGLKDSSAAVKNLQQIAATIKSKYGEFINVYLVVPEKNKPSGFNGNDSLLLDGDQSVHHRYGAASECLYLIRPDGYIGFRSQPADEKHLLEFLSKTFV